MKKLLLFGALAAISFSCAYRVQRIEPRTYLAIGKVEECGKYYIGLQYRGTYRLIEVPFEYFNNVAYHDTVFGDSIPKAPYHKIVWKAP